MAETTARIKAGSRALPSADALFYFLEDLRRQGYRIDARHIAAAQCLLAETRAEGAASSAARRIKFRLAPLIAKSPSQQQEFYRRFDAWQDVLEVADRIEAKPPAGSAAPAQAGSATEAIKRDPRRRVIAGALAAFLAVAALATWYFWPPPSPPQVRTDDPPSPPATPGRAYDLPQEQFEITEQVVSPYYAGLKAALAAAPLLAFTAWVLVRWRRRLLLMSRGVVLGDAALGSVRLPLKLSDVLFTSPELRAGAHDLRKHRYLPTHKLDAWRTVDATARQAGLFTPVYRERPQLPEYVFLIEQNGSNDHLARLFDLAVDRLRDEHVEIQRFYFHTDPRQVQAEDRSTVPLAELAARTDDHRLFIIATADGFFHPLTGEVESWVQRLEPWRSRTLLSTRPLEHWTMAELRLLEEGFSLATAEASGFAAAGEKIAAGTEEAELLEGVLVMPAPTRLKSEPPVGRGIMDRFEEYKFFSDGTQQLAERRQTATEVYLSINTAIFALIAFLLKDVGVEGRLQALLALPLFAVGVFACFVWYKLIYGYKRLIGWRYEQLMAMEKTLPDSYQMYSKEKEEFYTSRDGKEKLGFSTLEVWLPQVILALYIVYGGAFLVAKAIAP